MATTHHHHERGSVLLLVLVIAGLLAGLAAGFVASARQQIQGAGDVRDELEADLATQSGLEFAQRRLLLDREWPGTAPGGVILPGGGRFEVASQELGGQHLLAVSGADAAGSGAARIEATLDVNLGNPTSDKALVFLGRELNLSKVLINGDAILADRLGVVRDWVHNGEGGTWVAGGPASLEPFELSWVNHAGTLFKYSDTAYGVRDERQVEAPVYMPAWDLNDYLGEAPGRLITTRGGLWEGETFTDTVVFHLAPGESLTLRQCQFLGGVVVWCERTSDLRAAARNQVWIRDCNIGAGNAPHIGVLAPAANLGMAADTGEGGHVCFENHGCGLEHCCVHGAAGGSQIHGFTFVRSLKHLSGTLLHGQLFVVDEIDELSGSNIIYHNQVGENPPPGITTVDGADHVRVELVREVFD